ncbi:protein of unknown function [Cupriavidus taiwanensis]|nr:protein of unknown function [Cupriavidus taiwanensis]
MPKPFLCACLPKSEARNHGGAALPLLSAAGACAPEWIARRVTEIATRALAAAVPRAGARASLWERSLQRRYSD